jgi:hypothetical protein
MAFPNDAEFGILIPELKYYFTLPMRSSERKQMSIRTHRELAKLNPEHWTESRVRLWFNNKNKKYAPENATTIPTDEISGEHEFRRNQLPVNGE